MAEPHIYDLSVPVSEGLVTYGGVERPGLQQTSRQLEGFRMAVSSVNMSVHTGTHVDAPAHIGGASGVDAIPLDTLIGRCAVTEIPPSARHITAALLDASARLLQGHRRVLFKTTNSRWWANPAHQFQQQFVTLDLTAAEWLASRNFCLVGVDYLSVDRYGDERMPVHRCLLSAGIVVVETLNLRDVPAGEYELICLPLRLVGLDGSPARVILRELA